MAWNGAFVVAVRLVMLRSFPRINLEPNRDRARSANHRKSIVMSKGGYPSEVGQALHADQRRKRARLRHSALPARPAGVLTTIERTQCVRFSPL